MTQYETPLVSVIVPCFNYGKYLPDTLLSVQQQLYSNWECIIVDDGSTDDTGEVASKFAVSDNRFRYVYQTNAGLSAARNQGLSVAQGLLIQFLDADDLIHPSKLLLQVGSLQARPDAGLTYGDAIFFQGNNPMQNKEGTWSNKKTQQLKMSGIGAVLVRNLCINNIMEVSSALVRRSVIDKAGIFDTSYFMYEDWQFWFRVAVSGVTFIYEKTPGTETYIRYGHASMLRNTHKKVKYGIMLRKFMAPYLPANLRIYNAYRIVKLQIKKILLYISGK